MKSLDTIFIVISALGMINGLFLSIYFFTTKRESAIGKTLIAPLLITTSLRIGKSLIISLNQEVHGFYHLIWFGSLSLFGPLIYLIVRSCSLNTFRLKIAHLIHLLFPLLVILVVGIKSMHVDEMIVFHLIKVQMFLYLAFAFYILYKKSGKRLPESISSNRLSIYFVIAGTLAWLIYFSTTFFSFNFMMADAILYSVCIYLLTFRTILHKKEVVRSSQNSLSEHEKKMLKEKLEHYLVNNKPFLRNNLTMPEMAGELNITIHQLSRAINETYHQNFNDFINSYRIDHAKSLIKSKQYAFMKISTIANDSGFISISVFNTAFKKFTGLTPSQFRDKV